MSKARFPHHVDEPLRVQALAAFSQTAPGETRWFSPSLGHRDALSRLHLLTSPGALVVVSGESGIGKSLLVQVAVRSLPMQVAPVIAGDPAETGTDVRLLKSLIVAAGLTPQGRTGLELTSELLEWAATLGREGRIAAFIVDDAQKRPGSQLEIVRSLLSQASGRTPLSVVLLGAADLIDKLNRKRNLASRIALHYSLNPLSDIDGAALLKHRLVTAGCDPDAVFTAGTRLDIARQSGGNPGAMITLAFEALGGEEPMIRMIDGVSSDIPIVEPGGSQPHGKEVIS